LALLAISMGVVFASALAQGALGHLWVALIGVLLIIASFVLITPLRLRGMVIALHRDGLKIDKRGRSTLVLWDDVNEVWIARIVETRMRLHDGSWVKVPLQVDDPSRLYGAIVRGCSAPLVDEALLAIRKRRDAHVRPVRGECKRHPQPPVERLMG
jgi:hypothetical protein